MRLDKPDFPLPPPGLHLLFALYCQWHRFVPFEIDQQFAVISPRETVHQIRSMLISPAYQIAGHADVERAVAFGGHDVDECGHANSYACFHRHATEGWHP